MDVRVDSVIKLIKSHRLSSFLSSSIRCLNLKLTVCPYFCSFLLPYFDLSFRLPIPHPIAAHTYVGTNIHRHTHTHTYTHTHTHTLTLTHK